MAIFRQKPWVNPFGKMSIFRLFQLLVFIAQNGVFVLLEYRKRHFPGLHCLKKMEKWPFLDQNHGLTNQEKCQFLDFLNFLFYNLEWRFCRSRISQKTFSWLILPKKKVGKIDIFGHKPWVNPFGKMAIFDFLNFLFLQPRKAFFRSRIS